MQRRLRSRWVSLGVLVPLCLSLQLLGASPGQAAHVNLLNADQSTFEVSADAWAPWFSTIVARSTDEAHTGEASLRVGITHPFGWGAQLDNWPGVPASPGAVWIGFWGLAGSGAGLGATMQVNWHNAAGQVMRSDTATIPVLTGLWQRGSAGVIAPAGTVSATVTFSHASGDEGDVIYIDDISLRPVTNLPDNDTATLDTSLGSWIPWFSSTVTHNAVANGGNFGIQATVTDPHGWGIELSNWPGFAATAGPKTLGFSARSSDFGLGANMAVEWRDGTGAVLQTDVVSLPSLSPYAWQRASTEVIAPAGTATVMIHVTHATGLTGDIVYLDDFVVGNLLVP